MTYLQFFGLWLNRDRALSRKARSVQVGSKVASGKAVPGLGYYLAITDSEAEAKMLQAIDQMESEVGP